MSATETSSKFHHAVRVRFAGKELESRIVELHQAREERDRLATAKIGAAREFKKQSALVEQLTRETCDGEGDVQVECVAKKIFATNTVQILRCDTGEVVHTRAMTVNERQAGLFEPEGFDETDDKPAKKKTTKGKRPRKTH